MSNYTNENLINVPAANVPAGTLAMKIGDNIFTAGSVSINNGADFYKCTYVSSDSSMTWTGRLAIQDSATGVYSYSSDSTSGLTYSHITPKPGKVYVNGALAEAVLYSGIPADYVFYAPLSLNSATAETGQALSYDGTCTFSTYQGIPAMHIQSGCVTTGTVAQSGLDSGVTLSLWFSCDNYQETIGVIAHMGSWDGSNWFGVQTYNGASQLFYQSQLGGGANSSLQNGAWYHLIYQQANGNAKAWINGVTDLDVSATTTQCSGLNMYIGNIEGSTSWSPFKGYIAGVRLYNRVLTASERAALAAEFTPA